jgi:hypothetical protein
MTDEKKPPQKAAFSWRLRITSWQQVQRQQQRQRQQHQLGQQQQRQEPMRQQLELELVQVLQQVQVQELVLLLSYRKRPEQQLQRSLPKRVICSFFDSLMNIRKQFSGNGQP